MNQLSELKSIKISNISHETTYNELSSIFKIPETLDDIIKINYPFFHGTTTPKGYAFISCQKEETINYILTKFNNYYSHGNVWKMEREESLSQKTQKGISTLSSQLLLSQSIKQQYLLSIDFTQFYINKKLNYILRLSSSKTVFLLLCLSVSSYSICKLTHKLIFKKEQSKNVVLCINSPHISSSMINHKSAFNAVYPLHQNSHNGVINHNDQNSHNSQFHQNSHDGVINHNNVINHNDERLKEKMIIQQEIMSHFHITSLPCLLILEKGKEIQRGLFHQLLQFK